MRWIIFSCILIGLALDSFAQTYDNYYGNGNNVGIAVSSSSSDTIDNEINTVKGPGYFPDEGDAARFLQQAAFGGNYQDIQYVVDTGIENWIDEQLALPSIPFYATQDTIYQYVSTGSQRNDYLSYGFYNKIFNEPDQLRQKLAFALSQIFVVSFAEDNLNGESKMNADYYGVLYEGAFGNYRDLLYNITMHHAMSAYLTYFQNSKTDFAANIYPDENYAREIMQLFSIGVWQLNNDGTPKTDANGIRIPTYDSEDIHELSKVFTGLAGNRRNDGIAASFSTGLGNLNKTLSLKMFEDYHDASPKLMPDGTLLPALQSGADDINYAIDMLYNHPNVGPFIAHRLIQQFVKSNPSPQYINRVASVFNNNANGIRGDMGAVVKAILLDPEARDCNLTDDTSTGKLLQPIERFIAIWKALNLSTPSGKIYLKDTEVIDLEQSFLNAPSVFNFFSPSYSESDYISPNDLVSPEFEILNAITGIKYLNNIENTIKNDAPFSNYTSVNSNMNDFNANTSDEPAYGIQYLEQMYENQGVAELVNHLNLLLCRNQMNTDAASIITDAITTYQSNIANYNSTQAVKDAVYFIASTPNFTILK